MPSASAARKPEADDGDGRVRDRAQRGGRLGRVRREQRRGRGGGRRQHEPLALDGRAVGGGHAPAARPSTGRGDLGARARRGAGCRAPRASARGSSPRPSGNETGRPSPRAALRARIIARRTLPCSRSIAATRGRRAAHRQRRRVAGEDADQRGRRRRARPPRARTAARRTRAPIRRRSGRAATNGSRKSRSLARAPTAGWS